MADSGLLVFKGLQIKKKNTRIFLSQPTLLLCSFIHSLFIDSESPSFSRVSQHETNVTSVPVERRC